MTEKNVPLTRDGKARLEEELEGLHGQRHVAAERIHNTQEQGTSQNDAEYQDAKQEQGMIEGRILEVEDILRRATLINAKAAGKSGRVVLGSGVQVEQDGARHHYQIVGAPEANPLQGRISNESPVGASLLGKVVGDIVDVHVPKGVVKVKILKID